MLPLDTRLNAFQYAVARVLGPEALEPPKPKSTPKPNHPWREYRQPKPEKHHKSPVTPKLEVKPAGAATRATPQMPKKTGGSGKSSAPKAQCLDGLTPSITAALIAGGIGVTERVFPRVSFKCEITESEVAIGRASERQLLLEAEREAERRRR
jgi:hypothetical protein